MSLLIGVIAAVGAILLGELLYRINDDPARAFADLSQMLWYLWAALTLFVVAIVVGGTKAGLVIAGILAFTFWMFRARLVDVMQTDWMAVFGID